MQVPVRKAKQALLALDEELIQLGGIIRAEDTDLLVAAAEGALHSVGEQLQTLLAFLAGDESLAPPVTKGDVWNLYFSGDLFQIGLREDRLVTIDPLRNPRIFIIDSSSDGALAERWRALC